MRRAGSHEARRAGRRRQEGGFSLIEIMVAMVVTIVGLTGLLSLYSTSVQGNSRATRTITASAIAQQTMEELRGLPVVAPFAGYQGDTLESRVGGIPATEVPLLPKPEITGPDKTVYRRLVSVATGLPGDPLGNLVRVRVEVRWTDEGAALNTTDERLKHSLVLEAVRTRQDLL